MLEQIISFITPGPLTERFGFQTRVFTSWISLGFVLGLIMGIATLNSGVATPNGPIVLILQYTIGFPIIICLLGFMGLGLNSMRGGDAEHPGWYWYLFPIVTYIVIGFWFAMLFLGFFFALAGINVPSSPRISQPTRRRRPPDERAAGDWLKKNAAQSGDKFLRENPKFKPQNRQEETVYQEIVKNPDKKLEEITSQMSKEEFEAFIEMLMRMLGFTFLS